MAMTRGQAIDRINERLGFRTTLRSNIASALIDAQTELEKDKVLPKFLVVNQQALVTVTDTETVALPARFIREAEDDGPLWYVDSYSGKWEVGKDDMWFLRTTFIGEDGAVATGEPRMYALGSDNLHIFPLPDAVYNLKFSYYQAEPELSADGDTNKWLVNIHELLIGMAGKRIAEALRDINGITIFTNMEAMGRKKLEGASEAREHEGRRYVMGGDD